MNSIDTRRRYLDDLRGRMLAQMKVYQGRGVQFSKQQLFRKLGDCPDECERVFREFTGRGIVTSWRHNGWYSITGNRETGMIEHSTALGIAHEFAQLFTEDAYSEWTIAGSVRRNEPFVKDIEHVVVPIFQEAGLFATDFDNVLWMQLDKLLNDGIIAKAKYGETGNNRWGQKYRGVEYKGIKHEIFTATPDNFGAILCIRTGPAAFSQEVVTRLKRGGVYRMVDGELVRQINGELIPCPDERSFLNFAQVGWIEPEKRR